MDLTNLPKRYQQIPQGLMQGDEAAAQQLDLPPGRYVQGGEPGVEVARPEEIRRFIRPGALKFEDDTLMFNLKRPPSRAETSGANDAMGRELRREYIAATQQDVPEYPDQPQSQAEAAIQKIEQQRVGGEVAGLGEGDSKIPGWCGYVLAAVVGYGLCCVVKRYTSR